MKKQVISIKSINVDFQMRIDRWPEPGETFPGRDIIITGA